MFPILWLALWLAGLQARPAPRPDAARARSSIEGTVVRAGAAAVGTAEGLADARVELRPGNVSVYTNAGGGFTFRNLAPGRYTILFARDGFVPQEDRRRGLTLSGLSLTLTSGQTLQDVRLPMIPAPVLIGRVFDPRGEPLAAALVRAYLRQYTPYGRKLKSVRKGMTNDMGEFRLFGLNFGAYLISAGYSDRDRAAALGKVRLSANVSKADDGYATIFYDGTEEISRAQAAHLAPGVDLNTLNIYLTDSAKFKVRGQVLPQTRSTKIVLAPKGSELTEADYFIQPNVSGAFEIRAISPGSYVLHATAADGALSSDVITLNVTDRDIDGVTLALAETTTIPGGVFMERSVRTDLSGLKVKLMRSSVEFDHTIEAFAAPDGAFRLEYVDPLAEYDIVVEQVPADMYVRSISSAGRNVLPGNTRLAANQWLQIALAAATDDLEVQVNRNGDPAAGIQVVLVPEPLLRRRADRYVSGFTGESGDLRLTAVPPGRYSAYAFEQIEPGAYYAFAYSPAAESRFRDRAVQVTIGENGTKAIQLNVIPAAETAGGFE